MRIAAFVLPDSRFSGRQLAEWLRLESVSAFSDSVVHKFRTLEIWYLKFHCVQASMIRRKRTEGKSELVISGASP